jgi:hypothetical protein
MRILQTEFAGHGRSVFIKKRTKNPRVTDRINCTNSLLEHGRLKIHGSMKELKKDYESLAWKPGTMDLDLSDAMRGHISAALDYMVEFWYPLRTQDVGETSLDITL